jgi:hypothetical protein
MDESVSKPEKIWSRGDGLAALVAACVSGTVYFWTAAPNVTLLAWIFQLLLLGNAASEMIVIRAFYLFCSGQEEKPLSSRFVRFQ